MIEHVYETTPVVRYSVGSQIVLNLRPRANLSVRWSVRLVSHIYADAFRLAPAARDFLAAQAAPELMQCARQRRMRKRRREVPCVVQLLAAMAWRRAGSPEDGVQPSTDGHLCAVCAETYDAVMVAAKIEADAR